ncbi:FadR/GntR family transcriptional regulator [Martelella radicis]|uniref:DNA-binding FadR family transcriptional regulator n=1 Tax=Martelella radicis TaxID=1397476 RepID=A0A7W6KPN7_9HYPH|nr:FadR/GntR family transcriptional regulator [Martelella radicis]MBB4123755.1 DNA-binding FadR family transcriptional regulator [Martelella radicis]
MVKIEKKTLTEQTVEYILEMINSDRLSVGMEVPSEMQVIRELGVSRGVVREAFKSLEILGVLQVESGKRPKVAEFNPKALQIIFGFALATEQVETTHILGFRRLMEVSSVALAARNGTEEDFAEIRHHMDHIRTDIADIPRFLEHDIAFHIALADATKSPMYSIMLKALRSAVARTIIDGLYAERLRNHSEEIIELHQAITDAVCNRDEQGAMKAMDNHFDSVIEDLLRAGG